MSKHVNTETYNYTNILIDLSEVGRVLVHLLMWFDMTYVGETIYSKIHMAAFDAVRKHCQFHFIDSKATFHFTNTGIKICLLL